MSDNNEPKTMTLAGMEFTDIGSEQYREYVYESGFVLRIETPRWLHVSTSGSHRIIDLHDVSHRIDMNGCKDVRWMPRPGCPAFVK